MSVISIFPSAIAKRLLNGAAWSVIGTALAQFFLMGTTAIVSHILSKSEFGLYMLVQTTMNTLGIVAGFGLGTLVTRYSAALKETNKPRLERILSLGEVTVGVFGVFSVIVMLLLSEAIATNIFHDDKLTNLLRLACGTMLFTTVDNYQKSVLIGFERLRNVAIVSISGAFFASGSSVLLTHFYGIEGAAAGLVVSGFFQSLISRIALIKLLKEQQLKIYRKDWREELPLLGSFAIPALIANLLVPGAIWISQALLGRTVDGYAELALYGIAMQWFNALLFIPNIANKILTPLLAEFTEKKRGKDVVQVLKYALGTNLIVTSLVVVVFIGLDSLILQAYGRQYANGHSVLVMIGVAAVLASVMNIPGNLLSAHSRMWLGTIMNFGWATVYILASALFIAWGWGASGLAASLIIAYIAHLVWSGIWVAKTMKQVLSH